jgi:hypothetical protein
MMRLRKENKTCETETTHDTKLEGRAHGGDDGGKKKRWMVSTLVYTHVGYKKGKTALAKPQLDPGPVVVVGAV